MILQIREDVKTALARFCPIITVGAYAKQIESEVCLHPFLDAPTRHYIRYEAGTEEGISALFLHEFCARENLSNALNSYICELDFGYLTSETNISEEEIAFLKTQFSRARSPLLLVGSDFYMHAKKDNILRILRTLGENSNINIAFLSQDSKNLISLDIPKSAPQAVISLPENNGCIVYVDFELEKSPILRFSSEFARAWRLKNDEQVEVCIDDLSIQATCKHDENFDGIIGILRPSRAIELGWRYKQARFKKR